MGGPPQTEKRLLWHPLRDNKFVVGGGSQITMYELAADHLEIKQITSRQDLQFMKCFAWSPDPFFEDLMAVGLSTGRVDLIRLEATKHARKVNGLSSGPSVSLPIRISRSCNALAFCGADPNYLAVGLDKVRGDCSLVIWDINAYRSALSITPSVLTEPTIVSRRQPQIPQTEVGPRTDKHVLQQHAPTEIVSCLSFLPQSTNLLLAGISHRWLRLFDLRSAIPATTNIASKVHGIATDPFDPTRIGCFGDGVVTIWDARKVLHPLLTFTEKDAAADGARPNAAYTNIEFSSVRRGMLATLEKDSKYVRFWDISQANAHSADGSDEDRSRDSSRSRTRRAPKRSWTNLAWTAATSEDQREHSSLAAIDTSTLVLSDTRRTKNFTSPQTSFALVPRAQTHPLTSNVMVVNKDGDLELYAVYDTPKQAVWSARGALALGAGVSYRILPGFRDTGPPPEPWDVEPVAPAPHPRSASRVPTEPREESAFRGRGRAPTLFGRGDADGFPAVGSPAPAHPPTNLAATRPGPTRTYSPASLRKYHFAYSGGSSGSGRSHSRGGRREKSATASRSTQGIRHVVEDDILMVMRRRAIRGYGMDNFEQNIAIAQDDGDEAHMLPDLWAWIYHSREILCSPTPRLHGYDFSYEGLLGIWEGLEPSSDEVDSESSPLRHEVPDLLSLPTIDSDRPGRRSRSPVDDLRGNFHAALHVLAARAGGRDSSSWKPTVATSKLVERLLALQLCGWSLTDEDLSSAVKKWERDGRHSRAACWLVFMRQYNKAIDVLLHSRDESHHMMSGTLAALVPHGTGTTTRSIELRDHCERLIVKLQDPYLRAMLTHLAIGDWSEVLEEESLPFRERLAIAFQFLDDKTLSSYLRRSVERASVRGDIDSLVLTGLTPAGFGILQSYVDRTGDVQTAAILAAHAVPAKFTDLRATRWLEAYRDLLDSLKLHHHRVALDIARGARAGAAFVPRQALIRCNFCGKSVGGPSSLARTGRPTACPNCGRELPRCSVCVLPIGIVQDVARAAELGHGSDRDTIDDAIVFCLTCRHGGHAAHILEWFYGSDGGRAHGMCAVAGCACRCADKF